jgi:hypothetical protein
MVGLLLAFPSLRHAPVSADGPSANDPAGSELAIHDDELRTIAPLISALHEQWRHGRTDADFFAGLARATAAPANIEIAEDVALLATWARGGLALTGGNRERARSHLEEVASSPAFARWLPLLPARFVGQPSADGATKDEWRIDLFWGDPLGEARQRLEQRTAEIGERRVLALGLAVVDHLDGHPETAATEAIEIAAQFEGSPSYPLVARFVGDELLWSGDVAGALSWYNRLPGVTSPQEIGAVLRTLNLEGGRPLLQLACDDGFEPACRVGDLP